jgi:SAM-dependent methyltransferase
MKLLSDRINHRSNQEHWDYKLFVSNAKLYLPILQNMKEKSLKEVEALCNIFGHLGVPPGSKILDLSCGIGRHSVYLCKRGYEVVGYDPSPFFIHEAKRWAREEGLNEDRIRFYVGSPLAVGDVLSSLHEIGFNVIINMFNSHGYYGIDEDIMMFGDILRISSQNCILIIESENRDWRIRYFEPSVIYDLKSSLVCETWNFDPETSISTSHSRFYDKIRNGEILHFMGEFQFNYRLYSIHELRELIIRAGWKYLKTYGSIQGEDAATYDSKNIVTIGKKL